MKDGPLTVDSASSFSALGVGVHLTGTNATILFGADTTTNMTAPTTGIMAGLMLLEDPTVAALQQHQLLCNNAALLLGAIYLPHGRLIVDATSPIAQQSAFTIIVARRMELYSGPNSCAELQLWRLQCSRAGRAASGPDISCAI
jgi:hypothetical protein